MQKQEIKSKRRSRELEGPASWREHRAMISHHDRRAARDRQVNDVLDIEKTVCSSKDGTCHCLAHLLKDPLQFSLCVSVSVVFISCLLNEVIKLNEIIFLLSQVPRERLDSEGLPSPTEDCFPENQPPSPTSTTP